MDKKFDKNIKELIESNKEVESTINKSFEGKVTSLEVKIASMEDKNSDINASLEDKIISVEGQITDISTSLKGKIKSMKGQITSVEAQIDDLDRKLDAFLSIISK